MAMSFVASERPRPTRTDSWVRPRPPASAGHQARKNRPPAHAYAWGDVAVHAQVAALEAEANAVADRVLRPQTTPGPIPVRQRVGSGAVLKQEIPPTPPPSLTEFPGQTSQTPDEEHRREVDEGLEKLGEGLAMKVLSDAGKVPSIGEIYDGLQSAFEHPVLMGLAGVGHSATAAAFIIKNAADRAAEGAPGTFPISETHFGLKGSLDAMGMPSGFKLSTPLGDLPPKLGSDTPAAAPRPLFPAPTFSVSTDLIGERLRRAQVEDLIHTWLMFNQGLIRQPLERARPRAPSGDALPISMVQPLFKGKAGAGPSPMGPDVSATAAAGLRAGGEPMDRGLRQRMEARFGLDFGRVRIHRSSTASSAATSLGARAFTVGDHIAFGAGEYRPQDSQGLHLLAHELTHVVQQGMAGPRGADQSPPRV